VNDYGLYSTATSAATTNYGGYFKVSGGTNNYGLVVDYGTTTGNFVGIGVTNPAVDLNIASSIRIGSTSNAGLDYTNATGDLYLGQDNSQDGDLFVKNAAGTATISINSNGNSVFPGNITANGVDLCSDIRYKKEVMPFYNP